MYQFKNRKTFLLKDALQVGLKKFLLLEKSKISFHGNMLLMISLDKNANTNQQKFRIEKVTKKKVDKLYAKWKGYDLI